MNLKRYLLFRFYQYYPRGGWEDFAGDFDTFDEAKESELGHGDNYQIVDTTTKKVVG
jgi:hypothetical protein